MLQSYQTTNWKPSLRLRAAAELELRRRRRARSEFGAWLYEVSPAFTWDAPHLDYVRQRLEAIERGELNRLMIYLPPRHGKSELTTVRYPVWRMQRDPSLSVIVGAYNVTLAQLFSRKSRSIASRYLALGDERKTADEWETEQGGIFRAAGVGSGVTGRGAKLIVIDDPVKSREEANSAAYRERVWNWYRDDLYTRLEPGGAIILIMCMTGDTPVLMADGTERPLRDIKVGDQVATYDNGKLATSTVCHHRSNGLDSIFRIKTICGTIVHANARHPFLVEEHGQLKWIRLRDLTTAHRIVTVKDRRASGRARPVSLTAATNPLARGAIALSTTEKRCGPMGIARHRSMRSTGATCVLSSDTESPPQSMTPCTKHKAANAPFAVNLQATTCAPIGVANYALTIATKQTPSAGFCATTVTLPWDMPRQRKPHVPLSSISDFITAQIESIEPAGVEEVFDIQIERTENFIANGLVSHNTRWHEDDLAGRILASEDGPNWTVVSLPALAEDDDPLGRAPGAALWPARFDEVDLERIRTVLGTQSFTALYQQRPTALEGGLFKRAWFDIVQAVPSAAQRVRYWDKAGTDADGDYSAGVLMARDAHGLYYVESVVRGQWSALDRERVIRQTAELDGRAVPIWIEQEPGSGGKESAEATIRNLAGWQVRAERVTGDKLTRAQPFAAQCEAHNVRVVRGDWNAAFLDELTMFPNGRHDDQVDAAAAAFAKLADFDGVTAEQLVDTFRYW